MLARLVLGEPKKNYDEARHELQFTIGLFLYNRWKTAAEDNFLSLGLYLKQMSFERFIFRSEDILDAHGLVQAIATGTDPLSVYVRNNVSSAGKKLFEEPLKPAMDAKTSVVLLVAELNSILGKAFIHTKINIENIALSDDLRQMIDLPHGQSKLLTNRRLFESVYGDKFSTYQIPQETKSPRDITVLDVMQMDELRDGFVLECQNMLIFGHVYNTIIDNLSAIAKEANSYKVLSQASITKLLEPALAKAGKFVIERQLTEQQFSAGGNIQREDYQSDIFSAWLGYFIASPHSASFLSTVEEWKKSEFPRLSDTLLVIITFLFEKLLPEYYSSLNTGKTYEGRINPMRIGRRKDFWNRLSIAYQDLLIQELITKVKRKKLATVEAFVEKFFDDFVEHNATLMSADPVSFPGFRLSIEKALRNEIRPCGVVTGIGKIKAEEQSRRIGVVISNTAFQAGAFDMAGAEKFCKLLVECAEQKLPVICFVSSGGMQTKEGAASLFSMSIVNDRITRFVRDNDLPVIVFGFGDCTGGSQASFVTHPLVQTYYFSGTDMPFAGRVVVPSYLPSTATVSNYLYNVPGAMQGFVKHPFAPDLDRDLREIDPNIPLPKETVIDVFKRVIAGQMEAEEAAETAAHSANELLKPVKTVLIHARGCTAVKLIRGAQAQGINIVLVQSDPDMDSVPVDMLGPNGRVVCIGGNTSDESYLNALSVISVADYEGVDALHPGIGFLSESSSFAHLVRQHKINFIGPHVSSMETMGNKSNAINTALKMKVPVVPGSHGILTSSEATAAVAEKIGYPVLIKAVHGGGGKGIQVVEKPEDIHELFHQVTIEAKSAFGNGDIYLGKYVTNLRHIEVQVLRDMFGNCKILGLRDCSVQRNNQKIFEESGSTMLTPELEESVYSYATLLANEVDYIGAGTVEFIYDLQNNTVYFMEMNTRLQVEHPVTEFVTNIDIVGEQFRIASGESIENLKIEQNGYSIEVRITAEKIDVAVDGSVNFVPTPGKILECVMPTVDHISIISMAAEGKTISPFYDSLIAQVICFGTDREDTIEKLLAYLETIVIKGICTNISLVKRILKDDTFRGGIYNTGYLPKFLDALDKEALIKEITIASDMDGNVIDMDALRIEGSDEIRVLAPSTGVFYITPSPSEPSYVNVGDIITASKTMCQLEAMKLFSPLSLSSFNSDDSEVYSSAQKYEVIRINNVNGTHINQGDLLFVVKPVSED